MGEHASAKPGGPDEFYVGYLNPVPRGYARRVRGAVLGLVVLVLGSCLVIGGFQARAGDGVWETEAATVTGLFVAAPYPVLFVEGEKEGSPLRVVMLVGAGKCGAFAPEGYCGLLGGKGAAEGRENARIAAIHLYDGKLVQVKGTRLHRDGKMMIELDEGPRAVVAAADDPARAARLRPGALAGNRGWMIGRVVDAKCFLGAMRPGDGKAHRACAVRCISGGIPPMLVIDQDGGSKFVLLGDEHGRPLTDAILPFIGDDVVVDGTLRWVTSDISVLDANVAGLRRMYGSEKHDWSLRPTYGTP